MKSRNLIICLGLAFAVAALLYGGSKACANAGSAGVTFFANSPSGGTSGTALKKFVDSLPGLGQANANTRGQYIPVATPDTATYPDADYYEIGLKDYTQEMHRSLPKPTKLRGYYQINGLDTSAKYLGPLIIARKGRPVRLKFFNNLSLGAAGNLFIPVDTTAMGAGMGPPVPDPGGPSESYTQNRAAIHLHGGFTPWISDGTPHQWITPAGETTLYPAGLSQQNVPDMPLPEPTNTSGKNTAGWGTYYYTNDQSNRLMFYHDHAYGLTRLNVYAGEAAGYLLTDQYEDDLIDGTNVTGINPGLKKVLPNQGGGVYKYGIPLVIQDKSFVPADVATQDSKWDTVNWGQPGDLWFPHIYEPNQDPTAADGMNPTGRWDYGPWFWPVFPAKTPLPEPSMVPEAFMDTILVNGSAYPYLVVEPKAYRFRILNASNDRYLNLQLYKSHPNNKSEVKMVSALAHKGYPATWPTDNRAGGVPDYKRRGPDWVQIGSEGGFLPAPAVIPNQPVNYEYDRRNIVVLNVKEKCVFLGPAERADVVIDFSKYAGKTLILYNDSPAPVPAPDPRYDYYTKNPDFTANGGAYSTKPGYGPNTRTIMQIRVKSKAKKKVPFVLADLQTALPLAYVASQPAPIVPQTNYPGPYQAAVDTYSTIQANSLTFTPVGGTSPVTVQMQPKTIQELFDPYGRMNSTLGVEMPFTNANIQTTLPFGYVDVPTEGTAIQVSGPLNNFQGSVPINNGDAQIWKITHNGVDTHAIHFHLVNVQVINRVGWDGAIRPPDPNELGWKETVRMNPLEDCIVAAKFTLPTVPFAVPNSVRPLDVTAAIGSSGGMANFTPFDALNNPVTITNQVYDFGHEYVWHCHLLGHEENDMMRALVVRP
jgi:FtsP/CotA-like multicopper oxidase with cupredoxin domain